MSYFQAVPVAILYGSLFHLILKRKLSSVTLELRIIIFYVILSLRDRCVHFLCIYIYIYILHATLWLSMWGLCLKLYNRELWICISRFTFSEGQVSNYLCDPGIIGIFSD